MANALFVPGVVKTSHRDYLHFTTLPHGLQNLMLYLLFGVRAMDGAMTALTDFTVGAAHRRWFTAKVGIQYILPLYYCMFTSTLY
jgi:hypothetical protein